MVLIESPSVKTMKTLLALLFLLLTLCSAAPINTPLHEDATKQGPSRPDFKPLHTTELPTNYIKASLRRKHNNDRLVAKLSVPIVSETNTRSDSEAKAKPNTNALQPHQVSTSSVIQPAIRTVLSDETTRRASQLTEKLNKVDYFSSPLQGTETRDRNALGIKYPEEPGTTPSSLRNNIPQHQQGSYEPPQLADQNQSGKLNEAAKPASRMNPDSSGPQQNQNVNEVEVSKTMSSGSQQGSSTTIPNISGTDRSPVSSQSTNYAAQVPFKVSDPKTEKKMHEDTGRKEKGISALAKEVMIKTGLYGRTIVQKLKSTLKSLRPKQKSSNVSNSGAEGRNGYTEEDVLSLVNDIIREIQTRTDDMREHAAMLEKTDRWDPNVIAARERHGGVRERPLLYMRTKVHVTPETVVDAVMKSTKKMFSTRTQPLPLTETSKLLNEVQARLSEILIPAQ